MNSVFLDTNFFLDVFDKKRDRHIEAKEVFTFFLDNNIALYTSSDIISTISYFLQKKLDLKSAVTNIDFIVQDIVILVATNQDFIELNQMLFQKIKENSKLNIDYEDCMQLFLANKYNIDSILTSDKSFCKGIVESYNIKVLTLKECLKR